MSFEIFNRSTEKAQTNHLAAKGYVSKKSGYIAFNIAACAVLQIKMADRIELLKDGKKWYVIKSEDKSAYQLTYNGMKEASGLRASAKLTIMNMLYDFEVKDVGIHIKFNRTGHEFKGQPVFEIIKQ
jgi:hypothetical protein